MKKFFQTIGFLTLIFFSFFYTSKITSVIKENDDIMIMLNSAKAEYQIAPSNAIIENDTIIPGLSGREIDINKSYQKMKEYGNYNNNLITLKTIKPEISITKNYDKYIISGNPNKKMAAFIFKLDTNSDIKQITEILNKYDIKANFFANDEWFTDNNNLIVDLIKSGHEIGNLTTSDLEWSNTIVTKIANQKNTYCYKNDSQFLKTCAKEKSYTISPSIMTNSTPLINVKNSLKNGSIIDFNVNSMTLKELEAIIKFVNSKGIEIVNLQTLINE